MKHLVSCTFLILGLCSCASINPNAGLYNPPDIHTASGKTDDSRVKDAEKIPVDDYYKALTLARQSYSGDSTCTNSTNCFTPASPEVIQNYVKEGIGLADAYCLRWFDHLEELQTKVNYESGNVNIIRDLGTALLGIGKANSVIVTAYGAGNTAWTGAVKNFQDTFLLAPNTSVVKPRVLKLMSDQAATLKQKAEDSAYTFKEAYIDLEKYASICTARTAREISEIAIKDVPKEKMNIDSSSQQITISEKYQKDDETKKLLTFWKPDSNTVDSNNEQKLLGWMKLNGWPNAIRADIPVLLYGSHSAERAKAVNDLITTQ